MRKPSWGLSGAYALLALAVATTALAFTTLRVINDPHISGAGSGYRYYALGIQRSTGPDFGLSTKLIDSLTGKLAPGLGLGGVAPQNISFSTSVGARSVTKLKSELIVGTYLQAMHVTPLAGRLLMFADVRDGNRVVVLNATVARHLFGSARAAIGRVLAVTSRNALKGLTLRVVGVLPSAFGGIFNSEAWIPYTLFPALSGFNWPPDKGQTMEQSLVLTGMPAVLSAPANLSKTALRQQLKRAWLQVPKGDTQTGSRGFLVRLPFSSDPVAHQQAVRQTELYLAIALAALVLATINLFTLRWLTLVRRRPVLQLERTLGATQAWLRRRFLQRSLASVALMLGLSVCFALAGYALLKYLLPSAGAWVSFTSAAVAWQLAWILPLMCVIVVLVESMPLLLILMSPWQQTSRSSTIARTDRQLGMVILIAEVVLATVMSTAAAWAIHYAWQQRHMDLGMLQAPVTVVTINRSPTASGIYMTGSKQTMVGNTLLLQALRAAVKQVQANAQVAIGPLPLASLEQPTLFKAGRKEAPTHVTAANPQWLHVTGAQLLAGRNFSVTQADADAVLIDAVLARHLFGSVRAAVGKTLMRSKSKKVLRVIGVLATIHLAGPNHGPTPTVVYDFRTFQSVSFTGNGGSILIRPLLINARIPALRKALRLVLKHQAPQLELVSIQSSSRILTKLSASQTRQAQIFTLIALFAWAIALSGVAAHLRLYLAMRKRLSAIRSALGAGPSRLYREVVLGVLALAGAGIVLALLAVPWLATQFAFLSGAQVSPFGLPTWIALTVLLLAVFLVAHSPTRRAARAEPAESLHEL